MTEAIIGLIALTLMEIVLGIDNVVFIAIQVSRLPPHQQAKARRTGLLIALVMRLALLSSLSFVLKLDHPLFTLNFLDGLLSGMEIDKDRREQIMAISIHDLILLLGGLFLIGKSVHEIHNRIERGEQQGKQNQFVSMTSVITQIVILDIIFSLDSVITAVGMARDIRVMITAVILATAVMLIFAGAVSAFVERYPTVKMLALSFLILIGVMLVAEPLETHINKGYIYFAMAFALGVEFLNITAHWKGSKAT